MNAGEIPASWRRGYEEKETISSRGAAGGPGTMPPALDRYGSEIGAAETAGAYKDAAPEKYSCAGHGSFPASWVSSIPCRGSDELWLGLGSLRRARVGVDNDKIGLGVSARQ
ncbi:hypothetical protein GGTG_02403 [Gaeumannomyces tritici R3-111a-1]|uniref:Uncharacterized protein n=1 Tax=Gaeumannomyces tritici (strain R3-111a-1) TaxID=644352 RepID=J3NM99_GAET3|nr:hypothetical protein GGTG_02403 [Gaeumannomyces tritici R3-111a-1]EJT82430.1 hypothetical protein GGTG_02403 [Gaeumannomyces tritici R3-111a-1]